MTAQFQFFRAYPTKKPVLLKKKADRTCGTFSSNVDCGIHLGCTGGGSWTERHHEPGQDQGV